MFTAAAATLRFSRKNSRELFKFTRSFNDASISVDYSSPTRSGRVAHAECLWFHKDGECLGFVNLINRDGTALDGKPWLLLSDKLANGDARGDDHIDGTEAETVIQLLDRAAGTGDVDALAAALLILSLKAPKIGEVLRDQLVSDAVRA